MSKSVALIKKATNVGLSKVVGKINPIEAINNIGGHVVEWQRIKNQEQTNRIEINAKRDILIENIRAERDAFIKNLELNYKERSHVYSRLFDILDESLKSGNVEATQLAMTGILEQIKTNPIPTFGEFRKSLTENTALDF